VQQQLQHQLEIPTHFGGQIMSRFGPMIIAWADFTVISCSQCMPDEGVKLRGVRFPNRERKGRGSLPFPIGGN